MWLARGFLCEMVNDLYLYDPELRRRYAGLQVDIGEAGLTKVFYDITNRCNLRCQHCFTAATADSEVNELDTLAAKRLFSELAELGVRRVAFGGGEPLLRTDLETIVAHATRLGVRTHLSTSGLLLTSRRLRTLQDAGLESIQISIDSLHDARHDAFRGRPGLLRVALAAAERVLAAGMGLIVATTVTHLNLDELPTLMAGLRDRGVPIHRLIRFVPVGRGRETLRDLYAEPQDLFQTMRRVRVEFGACHQGNACTVFGFPLLAAGSDNGLPPFPNGCEAGKVCCDVLPDGTVVPCNYFGMEAPFVAGNVTRQPFREIWTTSPVLRRFREMDGRGVGDCAHCALAPECGKGCRAVAYLANGSLAARDVTCVRPVAVEEGGGP